MMTKALKKALLILRKHGPLSPGDFAKYMWPDSPQWRAHTKCGPSGVCVGGGMRLAGGGYLGKLRKLGLVRCATLRTHYDHRFELTSEGVVILAAFNIVKSLEQEMFK